MSIDLYSCQTKGYGVAVFSHKQHLQGCRGLLMPACFSKFQIPSESVLDALRIQPGWVSLHLCLLSASQQQTNVSRHARLGQMRYRFFFLLPSFALSIYLGKVGTSREATRDRHRFHKMKPDLLTHNCKEDCSISI